MHHVFLKLFNEKPHQKVFGMQSPIVAKLDLGHYFGDRLHPECWNVGLKRRHGFLRDTDRKYTNGSKE
jgi:hypothetical protein